MFLAVTSFDSDDTMLKILQEGGAGYILKISDPNPSSMLSGRQSTAEPL